MALELRKAAYHGHLSAGALPAEASAFHVVSGKRNWLFESTVRGTVVITEATASALPMPRCARSSAYRPATEHC